MRSGAPSRSRDDCPNASPDSTTEIGDNLVYPVKAGRGDQRLEVGLLLGTSSLAGESVLTAMGTSLAAFRVGGGIVVLMMAVSMLMAQPGAVRQTPEEAVASAQKEGVAVVPLGIASCLRGLRAIGRLALAGAYGRSCRV
jgi:hypothetical protein